MTGKTYEQLNLPRLPAPWYWEEGDQDGDPIAVRRERGWYTEVHESVACRYSDELAVTIRPDHNCGDATPAIRPNSVPFSVYAAVHAALVEWYGVSVADRGDVPAPPLSQLGGGHFYGLDQLHRHPLVQYREYAKMVRHATGLVPMEILGPSIPTNEAVDVIVEPPFAGRVVGIRLFHEPRDVILERIQRGSVHVISTRVDAAAYAVENPLPPLDMADSIHYRGEMLRLCAVDWGVISRETPLVIRTRAYGTPTVHPMLSGYLVLDPRDTETGHP